MPRGRPRKNPVPETETVEPVKIEPVKKAKESTLPKEYSFLTQAQYDKLPECARCHKKILSDEKNINLTYLTAMAPWHRKVSLDRFTLCNECAKNLNDMIDDWLIDNGNGIPQKWTLP